MTAIKKKRCILLTPHVYLLTYFWEVQSSLLVFSPPYPYGPPFWRKDRKMPKVREWVRCQRRPRFFHFNTWLWFVPAFSVPILKHKLDAIHSLQLCLCVCWNPLLYVLHCFAVAPWTCKQLLPDWLTNLITRLLISCIRLLAKSLLLGVPTHSP